MEDLTMDHRRMTMAWTIDNRRPLVLAETIVRCRTDQ